MTRALSTVPNTLGRFGPYGGRYVPETLVPALEQLELAYAQARADPAFNQTILYQRPQDTVQ